MSAMGKSALTPILDRPSPLLGKAPELVMGVHGDRLVGPFEGGPVRDMV
jgi:hypothetical protein